MPAPLTEASAHRHLDLGCGAKPRNPYQRADLYGVDLGANNAESAITLKAANLSLQPIPFPSDHFASVSAYDFLEHVPRVLTTSDGRDTRFPFVELMNEIWRVLVPGGLFYAQTPAYPHAAAFQDPTHVNIITDYTHSYFVRPTLLASMYGFRGEFECLRMVRIKPESAYEPWNANWRRKMRVKFRERRGALSHLVWELKAVK
jgi:SAM-dependent methyltransferase